MCREFSLLQVGIAESVRRIERLELSDRLFSSVVDRQVANVMLVQRITSICQQATTSREWQLRPKQISRWENNLTGWTSAEQSSFSGILNFPTRQTAESYCKQNGLSYAVMGTHIASTNRVGSTIISGALRKELKPKSYGDNFSVRRKGVPIWP